MIEYIKQKISDYIGFDVSEIICEQNDFASIFGGAIRDSISNREIHDIDILCLSNSCKNIAKTIKEHGFKYNDSLTLKDVFLMYKDIQCIFEPRTYVKGDRIIQLIRPRSHKVYLENQTEHYYTLLKNVDLSCCGVSLSHFGLTEHINNAIKHCEHNIFVVNKNALMYNPDRIHCRTQKLEDRGWRNFEHIDKKERQKLELMFNRKNKLERII